MGRDTLIAVSQRVAEIPSYGEVRDCLDQAWTSWLESCGLTPVPVPNRIDDPAAFLDRLGVAGVILTGGNDLGLDVYDGEARPRSASADRDRTEMAVVEHCADVGLPVVGFCRGMQTLHTFTGGRLRRLTGGPIEHVASFHEVSLLSDHWRRLAGASTIEVNSFHDFGFGVEHVTADWEVAAVTEADGQVEGIVHLSLPFLGVHWHPERENRASEFDRKLVETAFGLIDSDADIVKEVHP